jgi:uncharacterized protein (TIGR00730 family)
MNADVSSLKAICVYCGSSDGLLPDYLQTARAFGRMLAANGLSVVYGGGRVGLMGAVADGALEAGGRVVGVIPQALAEKEVEHQGLTELYVVSSMHERKMRMASMADAFVALPGGIGTLEEIFEVLTWAQLGFHSKPCAFLNVADFYSPLLQFVERLAEQRFIKPEHLSLFVADSDMHQLLCKIQEFKPVPLEKWLRRETSL